ncbi:unnamed protein product [Adineta steineri]|uniref:Uncharacterized protein n=1 Tax=Adineta steineri TaxID=433720 RepID=A0A819QPV0_9BILA|nr:unnamed protein product [Adineta steineri]CAF4038625.1 unnamed protein product [Adineta steineri]
MPVNKVNTDTNVLSEDVFSYMDQKFYDLVQELTKPDVDNEDEDEDEVKLLISQSIKKWCNVNKESLGLVELDLEESEHYTVYLVNNKKDFITCKCNEQISLFKFRRKFQLSNLYRHYRASKCSMLNQMKKSEKEQKNDRVLAAIAASLSPTDARDLLLSSTKNSNGLNVPNTPATSSITQSSNATTTNKRRTNTEARSDLEPQLRKKKKKRTYFVFIIVFSVFIFDFYDTETIADFYCLRVYMKIFL